MVENNVYQIYKIYAIIYIKCLLYNLCLNYRKNLWMNLLLVKLLAKILQHAKSD